MKIVVVGASGTIGKAVVRELGKRHTIITAGFKSGDIQVDIRNVASIQAFYEKLGDFDALVCTAGKVHFAPLTSMKPADYEVGLQDKLMGQVNLVLLGLKHINDHGSFTLTSGLLSDDPIVSGSSASMVNGAINSFVVGAAIELPRGIRVNAISPTVIAESMSQYADFFRGYEPAPAECVALAYSKSVEGAQTGKIYKVGW